MIECGSLVVTESQPYDGHSLTTVVATTETRNGSNRCKAHMNDRQRTDLRGNIMRGIWPADCGLWDAAHGQRLQEKCRCSKSYNCPVACLLHCCSLEATAPLRCHQRRKIECFTTAKQRGPGGTVPVRTAALVLIVGRQVHTSRISAERSTPACVTSSPEERLTPQGSTAWGLCDGHERGV